MTTRPSMNRRFPLGIALLVGLAFAPGFVAGQQPPGQAAPGDQPPAVAPFAILKGRVTTRTGDPLPGVRVLVAIPATNMKFVDPGSGHTVLEAKSGANGEYRLEFPGIAGRTRVSIDAMMPGFRRLSGTWMVRGDQKDVEIVPGAAVEADFSLDPARFYAGTVVDEQGKPIAGAVVFGHVRDAQATFSIERTSTRADGSFEIYNFPIDPIAPAGEAARGFVAFSHPDYMEVERDDIDAIPPDGRARMRVVLPTGRKIAGTVLDVEGKPVPGAMVEGIVDLSRRLAPGAPIEAVRAAGGERKATSTDAEGRFTLRGLRNGPTTLSAQALEVMQKAQMPIDLDVDRLDLQVRLAAITLPAGLKTYEVLGMKLADVTPELRSAYDLRWPSGVLIIDPGEDPDRLKIGRLAEGHAFVRAGDQRVATTREFVDRILVEAGPGTAAEYSIRVVYTFVTPERVGTNTQYLKLTREDIKQLRAISDRLNAAPR